MADSSESIPSTFARSRATTPAPSIAPAAPFCTPRAPIRAKWPNPSSPSTSTPDRVKKLPFDGKHYDFTPIVLENLDRLGIGCLVTIGGDDTLSFSAALSAAGMPVIAIPKTMDNDVQGTEYCIGFSTAITRAKELITRQRTTLGSHERIGIFRIFGRDAGFTALYTAYVTSTRCLIPEYPFDLDHVAEILSEDKHNNLSHYALVVVSEGAIWKEGSCRRNTAKPTPTAIARKPTSARPWARKSAAAPATKS